MYRKSLLILIAVIFPIISPLYAEWVSLSKDLGEKPQIQVLLSDENQVVVEVSLPGFYKNLDRDNLYRISLPGYATKEEIGKSAIPVIGGILALPENVVKVNISEYQNIESLEFKGIQSYPFQKPLRDGESEAKFSKDQRHYRSNELFPSNTLELGRISVWRDQKVITFRLSPMQVRPVSGTLNVYSKVRFRLTFEKAGTYDLKKVEPSGVFESMYRSAILNYAPKKIEERIKSYLIISTDALYDAIKPLADRRISQGFNVTTLKLSQIGGVSCQNIKAEIKNQFQNKGTSYVLLVGDHADLPLYMWGSYPSDYWYACLTENAGNPDMFPELAIGRISATNTDEVATYITKIQSYENASGDWLKKILVTSHKEQSPGKYHQCVEETKVQNYIYNMEFIIRHGVDQANTNAEIERLINEGVGLIAYRGHGDTNYWAGWNGSNFSTTNVRNNLNNTKYPVFFSIACYNSRLDSSIETLGEACVKHSTGGSCAFLGATRPSYTIPNHDFYKKLFSQSFGEINTGDNYIDMIGDISNKANLALITIYGESSYAMDNLKMYLWLGCPCTKLHLEAQSK